MEYEFTLEQIEARASAKCNIDRLLEHRDCNYCHLCFDCDYYKKKTGESLCNFVTNKLNSELIDFMKK